MPCPPPGDLPNPGIKPVSSVAQGFSLLSGKPEESVAQLVKNPPAIWETWVQSLGWEDPLEKGKATHPSILAWRTPWIQELVGLDSSGILLAAAKCDSPWGRKESDTTERLSRLKPEEKLCASSVYFEMYLFC